MIKILDKIKSKITIANWLFIIPAIIHFAIVFILQYKFIGNGELSFSSFNFVKFTIFIFVKIITLCLLILFYQLILIVIKGYRNNNQEIKGITKHFLIYFLLNLVILLLIFPGLHTQHSLEVSEFTIRYDINPWFHCLTGLFQLLAYNCIPSLFGLSLCNIFTFSLIFASLLYLLEKEVFGKFTYIMYLPFILPVVLIINSYPFRGIYALWMFILLFSLIFISYKTHKYISSYTIALIVASFSAMLSAIRSEYIILLILCPLMIYLLKIFDRKRFLTFLISFLLLFSGIFIVNKIYISIRCGNNNYEIHNLMFIYEKILSNNKMSDKLTADDKLILSNIYYEFDKKGTNTDINTGDVNNVYAAIKILTKNVLINAPEFIKQNVNMFSEPVDLFADWILKSELLKEKNNPINNDLKIQTINYFTSQNSQFWQKYIQTIGNPIVYYIVLFWVFIAGFISRNYFYTWYSTIFILIFTIIMMTSPCFDFIYILPCYICAQWIFIILFLDILKYFKNRRT